MTSIITHKFFGRGRHWNGKLIRNDYTGINQFSTRQMVVGRNGMGGGDDDDPIHDMPILETAHQFHYEIGPTQLKRDDGDANDDDNGGTSLKHDYAPYHPFLLSPWRSMKDELRWIPCASGKVMIGIGYFGWSGGVWNASPFLLYMLPSSAD